MKYWKFNLSAVDSSTFGTFNKRLNGVLVGKKIVEIIRNDSGVGIRSVKTENGDYVFNDGGSVIVTNDEEEVLKRSNHNSLITEREFSAGCLVEYGDDDAPSVKYLYGRKLDVLGEGEDYYFCRDQTKKEEFLVDKNSENLRDYPDEGCLILSHPHFPYYKVEEYINIVDGRFDTTSGKIREDDPEVLKVYASDMFQALTVERKERIKEFEKEYASLKKDILSTGFYIPEVQ